MLRRVLRFGVLGWATVVALLAATTTVAQAADEGPPLQVPPAALQQSLQCTIGVADAERTPVLLIPGTTQTPETNFSWNFERAFDAAGRPYCTVTLPNHAMSDIQISAEYVVHAIRAMRAASEQPVDVVGFSQGGMIGRWALKYWPDTRDAVDDLVGLSPSNYGTIDANGICSSPGGCAPSIWQQRTNARFLRALNSGPDTYDAVDYTVAYTTFDEVVVPNFGRAPRSALRGGGDNLTNVAIQQVCPGRVADHLLIGTSDSVGYALALDALDNDGPAEPVRVDRAVCAAPFMPGVDPATFPTNFATVVTTAGQQVATYPRVPVEPPLMQYAQPSGSRGST